MPIQADDNILIVIGETRPFSPDKLPERVLKSAVVLTLNNTNINTGGSFIGFLFNWVFSQDSFFCLFYKTIHLLSYCVACTHLPYLHLPPSERNDSVYSMTPVFSTLNLRALLLQHKASLSLPMSLGSLLHHSSCL